MPRQHSELRGWSALARRLEQKTRNPYIATPFEERTRRAELEAWLFRPGRRASRRREGALPSLPSLPSQAGATTTGRRRAIARYRKLKHVPPGSELDTRASSSGAPLWGGGAGSTERLAVDVAAVRKAHRDVAPDVACCALADAEGSVAEAPNVDLGSWAIGENWMWWRRLLMSGAVVLAAGPQESFPTSEEEASHIKPIARKSPDRVMQLASVDRMMHPDDKLGCQIASLMAIAAPPRDAKRKHASFISRHIGGKVRHLGALAQRPRAGPATHPGRITP